MKLKRIISLAVVFAMLISAMCFTTASAAAPSFQTPASITVGGNGTNIRATDEAGVYNVDVGCAGYWGHAKNAGILISDSFPLFGRSTDGPRGLGSVIYYADMTVLEDIKSMQITLNYTINSTPQTIAFPSASTYIETNLPKAGQSGKLIVALNLWNKQVDIWFGDTKLYTKNFYHSNLNGGVCTNADAFTGIKLIMGNVDITTNDVTLYKLGNINRVQSTNEHSEGEYNTAIQEYVGKLNGKPQNGVLSPLVRYAAATLNKDGAATGNYAISHSSTKDNISVLSDLPSRVDFAGTTDKFIVFESSITPNAGFGNKAEMDIALNDNGGSKYTGWGNYTGSTATLFSAFTVEVDKTQTIRVIVDVENKTAYSYIDNKFIGSKALSLTGVSGMYFWFTPRADAMTINMPFTATYTVYPEGYNGTINDVVATEIGTTEDFFVHRLYMNDKNGQQWPNCILSTPLPEGYTAYLVAYSVDDDGVERMSDIRSYTSANGTALTYDAEVKGVPSYMKLFIWDAQGNPVMASRVLYVYSF